MIRRTMRGRPAMALLFVAACGNDSTGTDMGPRDLSLGDMAMPRLDMAPRIDMALPPPMLTIPSTCTIPASPVTLASFYGTIINGASGNKCANAATCHVLNGQLPRFTPDMNGFRTSVVNVSAGRTEQAPNLMQIKPNDPDNSFLLYKITGQQNKLTLFPGVQMPYDGPPYLSPAEQCTLINWVRTGAT
jgi:hypothetical protein